MQRGRADTLGGMSEMDPIALAGLWINGGMLVATAGATTIAWKQARRARTEKNEALAARNETVTISAEALDRMNLIAQAALDAQRLALPAPWGTPTRLAWDSSRFRVENTSGRTMIVEGLDLGMDENITLFGGPELPQRVEYGDSILFSAHRGFARQNSGNSVVIRWRFDGDPMTIEVAERRFWTRGAAHSQ